MQYRGHGEIQWNATAFNKKLKRLNFRSFHLILSARVGVVIGVLLLHLLRHGREELNYVVQSNQVTVLVIAHLPVVLVVDRDAVGQRIGFGEVDQPAAGVSAVVQEQQGTSDNFVRLKEL